MRWEVVYYSERVRQGIEGWPIGVRAMYARLAERIQAHGPNLGMPFTRPLGRGLFEIRAKGREGIGRAFFCAVVGARVVVLHQIVKKSEKTPKKDLELARRRLAEVEHENSR